MGIFDEIAISDAAMFLDGDLMPGNEEITYTPKGESPRTIRAQIFRNAAERIPGSAQGFSPYIDFMISRDAVAGVPTVIIGGDKVTIAGRQGGTEGTYPVEDIVAQDSGSWTLRINVNG